MHAVQELALVALGRDLREFHLRMLQQQAHQISANVAGATGNCDSDGTHASASCTT